MDQGQRDRVRKYGEVFTPQRIVVMMCDELERNSPGAFDIGKSFLEPCCGDGVFVLEILRRKFACCERRSDFTEALRSVYAMDIQPWCVEATIANVKALCGEYFALTKAEEKIIEDHVILADSLKVMRMISDFNQRDADCHGGAAASQ